MIKQRFVTVNIRRNLVRLKKLKKKKNRSKTNVIDLWIGDGRVYPVSIGNRSYRNNRVTIRDVTFFKIVQQIVM